MDDATPFVSESFANSLPPPPYLMNHEEEGEEEDGDVHTGVSSVSPFNALSQSPVQVSRGKAPRKMCRNCDVREYDRARSSSEVLCTECLRILPRVTCCFCRRDFHRLLRDSTASTNEAEMCYECRDLYKTYGEPKHCENCRAKAAFYGSKCPHCIYSENKYGPATRCEKCKLKAAFLKPAHARAKVGGKLLCLLCTRDYKLRRRRESTKRPGEGGVEDSEKRSKHHHRAIEEWEALSTERDKLQQRVTELEGDVARRKSEMERTATSQLHDVMQARRSASEAREKAGELAQLVARKEQKIMELNGMLYTLEKELRYEISTLRRKNDELMVERWQAEKEIARLKRAR